MGPGHRLRDKPIHLSTYPGNLGENADHQEMPRCNGFTCRAEVPRLRDVGGTISIAPTRSFLAISKRMRVLVLIVIIGVLISLGWSKPFKERYAEAKATITSELNKLGKKPQKNHDSSGKRH